MSRIGNAPVPVPSGVEIQLSGSSITVKGPKGQLSQQIPGGITVAQEDGNVLVERPDDERESRALHGLTRSLVNNMVVGVTEGFRKELDIVGVGYRAAAQGKNKLDLSLGFSHPGGGRGPRRASSSSCRSPPRIEVHGIDKQLVGQVAANIRSLRKPEPYKGKGVRYVDERVRRKAGKAGK